MFVVTRPNGKAACSFNTLEAAQEIADLFNAFQGDGALYTVAARGDSKPIIRIAQPKEPAMTWEKIERAVAKPAIPKGVKVQLKISKKGTATMMVSVPSALAGVWDHVNHVDGWWGSGDNAGLLRLQPSRDAYERGKNFKLHRTKFALLIRLPDRPGFPDKERKPEVCGHIWEGDALDISLPDWARANRTPLPPDIHERTSSTFLDVHLEGTTVRNGKLRAKLTPTEAQVFKAILKGNGQPVHRDRIHHQLYGTDPNGGAEPKIIDVYVSKARRALAIAKLDIIAMRGEGYALRHLGDDTKTAEQAEAAA